METNNTTFGIYDTSFPPSIYPVLCKNGSFLAPSDDGLVG